MQAHSRQAHSRQAHSREARGDSRAESVRLLPGRLVPGTRYRIVRWLGEGAMGVVYQAEHADLERRVALKVLRVDRELEPEMAQQFRAEARAASKIGSEFIIDVLDFGELTDGRLLFAMELLEGKSLVDEVMRGPLEPARFIAIFRQICKGLSAAHHAGVIHRDIKPDNIMLTTRNGRPDHVKIVDFGIARILSREVENLDLSTSGTPYYMSPEQCAGQPYDGRLDLYALGCTAYELLTGRPPFFDGSVEDVLRAHLDQTPVPPSQANPDAQIPEAIEQVVLRCLAKHPDDRFVDMRDLEAALCEAQVAAGLETAWDDLTLPEVEPERREALLRDMPSADIPVEQPLLRRWAWPLVLGGAVAGAVVTSSFRAEPAAATTARAPVDPRLESLQRDARAAAAQAYYVYPPVGGPDDETAFRKVLSLESLGGSVSKQARESGRALRSEFAETLVRLGNQFWSREGGQGFARDYYAMALAFEPDHHRARERAGLTPGLLAEFLHRAATGAFTDAEREAAKPLVILADPDVVHRTQALSQYYRGRKSPSLRDHNVAVLLAGDGVDVAKLVVPPQPDPEPEPEGATGGDVEEPAATPPVVAMATPPRPTATKKRKARVTVPKPSAATVDAEGATALTAQAKDARASGRRKEAARLYHQALAANPRHAPALSGLSDLYFDSSDHEKALAFAERAVTVRPNNQTYRLQLGDAYFKVLRYEDARREYEKAQELGSTRAATRLAKLKRKLGE